MNYNFLYKTFVFAVLFSLFPLSGMNKEEIRNAFALWAPKKIRIQEIPFDERLLDGKTIIDNYYSELQKYETMQMKLSSTLLFDKTDKYLERRFDKNIEFTEKDSYVLSLAIDQNLCTVTYDLKNLQKIGNESLTFIQSAESRSINNSNFCKDIFIQTGVFVYDHLQKLLIAFFDFIKDKKSKESGLHLFNFFDKTIIGYSLPFSHKVTDMSINNTFTMIAVALDDGRILLISPIPIDNFRTFHGNYDVQFFYSYNL